MHTQRNSGNIATVPAEVRQSQRPSQTNRSLTLQSQGARAIGLNKNLQHRLAYIETSTPHRLLYNTGPPTDNEM